MKRENLDWNILRGSLITLLASITITVSLVGGSLYLKKQMEKQHNRNQAEFQTISQQYLEVDKEEDLIKEYYPKFIEYYQKGILGKEQRLNWLEVLRKSGDKIKLPKLRYEITSQEKYSPDYNIQMDKFQVYSSGMKLSLDLLHEGDFIRLLKRLNEEALGQYSISSCKFSRMNSKISDDISKGNIFADCNLNWFNIRESDGDEIKLL